MPKKLLLDTDIGSDVDDAVCLAYLLSHPECDLMGITTVHGQPERRAAMASAMCIAAGREDIPIYPGSAEPILRAPWHAVPEQADALDHWPHREDFPRGEAVEFLRRTIRAHPGEITLLTIGQVTNIGLLFSVDPEIPGLLKGLVMMGGLFTNRVPNFGPAEWNLLADPHASAIVYTHPVATHRSVGLEVTTQVVMSADEVRQRFTAPIMGPVLDFAEIWFRQWGGIMFHDPLAAAVIFNNDICQFQRGRVEIELQSQRLAGFTHWTPDPSGPHEVALEIKPERFFEEYFSVFPA